MIVPACLALLALAVNGQNHEIIPAYLPYEALANLVL